MATCVAATAVTILMFATVAVEARARRAEVSGRNAVFCSVWVKQKLESREAICLRRNGLTSVYYYSERATVISGYEGNLDPAPVRNGMRACPGLAKSSNLPEGSSRDAGGNLVFDMIDCSLKYINYMDGHDQ